MSLFSSLCWGAGSGLVGAAAAHVLVTLAHRSRGEMWLKGPHGPPFFGISLYMGVLLGAIGWGLSRRWAPAAAGFLGPFLGIALPLIVLTRSADLVVQTWVLAVTAVYALATWGTMAGLGALLGGKRPWLAAGGAALGAFSGYLALAAFLRLVPSYQRLLWNPTAFWPSPVALLDGLLTGAGLAAGIWLAAWRHENEKVRAA